MRFQKAWTGAAAAFFVLSGAAFAEVTVSQSNDPSTLMGAQMASLLGAEHQAVDALPAAKLTAMAVGPKLAVAPKVAAGPKVLKVSVQADKSEAQAEKPADAEETASKAALQNPVLVSYSADWLMAQPAATGDQQWQCLKTAIYFESRGESLKGQFAVAEVVLNRVDSPRYPKTICGVVQQRGSGSCAFSYSCDGAADVMTDRSSAEVAGRIARVMLDGAPRALTAGATYFHTRAVSPSWSRQFPRTASIGAHLFYRQP